MFYGNLSGQSMWQPLQCWVADALGIALQLVVASVDVAPLAHRTVKENGTEQMIKVRLRVPLARGRFQMLRQKRERSTSRQGIPTTLGFGLRQSTNGFMTTVDLDSNVNCENSQGTRFVKHLVGIIVVHLVGN
jgi:hypothetical protein